ncbi:MULTISPECIES: hypothetical protein [Paenibacillus]|uniref:Uncharacterized protein n=1 Tax=Paenibacillus radicis (ex Xue et al. 2023) TaxID=2972489 RepID=A0ABT1YT97_9BACL|nr:hypothetical protein [Paenibacillus radicis (ex Xue et al. 2023)]MCR8635533.1 hypothetical protein [Paenibacillus radicis (ex Xue et al. 2023)]
MNVSNCRGCGKLHMQAVDTMCADCLKSHIADARAVRAFIQANPGANVMDLVKQTGFSLKKVNELINR